ncbi:hypothetical protein PGTUg99_035618 [Puccinia graminis f. sp. tritici]|uniref:Uncharacterized protein n=1 Tax=Puccinia graminis f. sp. tritici TaxID=56615 RepID=A0A5B0LW23_PUCGR|nr:hypothetical protein PGTUg99_035618 [Puccinia graminis f. sp. tritici]
MASWSLFGKLPNLNTAPPWSGVGTAGGVIACPWEANPCASEATAPTGADQNPARCSLSSLFASPLSPSFPYPLHCPARGLLFLSPLSKPFPFSPTKSFDTTHPPWNSANARYTLTRGSGGYLHPSGGVLFAQGRSASAPGQLLVSSTLRFPSRQLEIWRVPAEPGNATQRLTSARRWAFSPPDPHTAVLGDTP